MPPSSPRRTIDVAVVVRIAVALVAVVVACVVAAQLLGPDDDGSAAAFERTFLSACGRSGAEDEACACALAAWSDEVGEDFQRELDRILAEGEGLPAPLDSALGTALGAC